MKKNIFAVCDLEAEYAQNFMNYLNQKKNIPFEIQAFTNVESLISYARGNPIELLLISGKAMCQEVRELEIGKVVVLSEGVHLPELDSYPTVYKYQSSDQLIREVMACYGTEKVTFPAVYPILKKKTEILGVYSPGGCCLKTSFALTLGQILAKSKSVLYLNLEAYSGFESLFGKSFSHDLSDLLYFVRQDNPNLMMKMNSMIQTVNNLDFVPPVQTPYDIRTAAWQEWERLLLELMRSSSYEIILLDIGEGIDEVFQMLEMCNVIYIPVLKDVVSEAKITQFENMLRVWDYPQVLTRTVKLQLPSFIQLPGRESYVEKLMWSELGDYVKDLLRKDSV